MGRASFWRQEASDRNPSHSMTPLSRTAPPWTLQPQGRGLFKELPPAPHIKAFPKVT